MMTPDFNLNAGWALIGGVLYINEKSDKKNLVILLSILYLHASPG
jgi:hypothetical protein